VYRAHTGALATIGYSPAVSKASSPHVNLAVDLVILTIREQRLNVLLIERGKEPFLGQLALPGGFLHDDEDLDDAAVRELEEETGIRGENLHLEQLRTYAAPGRDPRGRVASVAYLAIAPHLPTPVAGTDAAAARWMAVDERFMLAFDHEVILRDAIDRAQSKLEYSPLATRFCQDTFTIGELRSVYEVVWGVELDPRNFHRKVTGVEGFVVPTGERRNPPTGRPAALYRAGNATILYPAMLQPAKPKD
jgi:8-oxo-dGTP diphosphatase